MWSPDAEKAWRDNLYKNAPNSECAGEEYGCVPRKSGGAYLSRPLIEAAMAPAGRVPLLRFEAPAVFELWSAAQREAEVEAWCQAHLEAVLATLTPDCRYCFGEDFARKGDLSVFVVLAIAPDLSKREALRVELRNVTYDQQKQIMLTILTRLPRLVGPPLTPPATAAIWPRPPGCISARTWWIASHSRQNGMPNGCPN